MPIKAIAMITTTIAEPLSSVCLCNLKSLPRMFMVITLPSGFSCYSVTVPVIVMIGLPSAILSSA